MTAKVDPFSESALDWIDQLCRRFSAATGWPMRLVRDDAVQDSCDLSFSSGNDCCWHAVIGNGEHSIGSLQVFHPPQEGPVADYLPVIEFAETIAGFARSFSSLSSDLATRTQDVSMLADIGRSVHSEDNVLGALQRLLNAAVELADFHSSAFFLLDAKEACLRLRASHMIDSEHIPHPNRALSTSPADMLALSQGPLVLHQDENAEYRDWIPNGMTTAVCIPIRSGEDPLGTLWVFDRRRHDRLSRSLLVLESLAAQIAAVLERVVLLQESEAKQRIQRELAVVSGRKTGEVQSIKMSNERFEIAARCESRWEIGGDLCDLIEFDETHTAIAVGDASGDGIPAAMVMTAARGALRAIATGTGDTHVATTQIVRRINQTLCEVTPSHQFMTLLYGVFDSECRTFTYTNAGHPPPILIRRDQCSRLSSHGMLLGVSEDVLHDHSVVHLSAGDVIILFTDGIVEATGRSKEMFSYDGVIAAARNRINESAEEILQSVWRTFERHIDGGRTPDDRTLLVFKIRE